MRRKDEARRAYERQVTAAIAVDDEGRDLLARRAAAEKAVRDFERKIREFQDRIRQAEDKAVAESEAAGNARKAYDAARSAHSDAMRKQTEAERRARDEARRALGKAVDARLASQPSAVEILRKLKDTRAAIAELDGQIRRLRPRRLRRE